LENFKDPVFQGFIFQGGINFCSQGFVFQGFDLDPLLWLHAYKPILYSSAEHFKRHTDFEGVGCVILDVNLGDGSGLELMRGLLAAGYYGPVICITGNTDPAVRKAALDSGCIAYLIKPFPEQSLIEPLKRAFRQRS
jgi:FixJ family two-component response regulator